MPRGKRKHALQVRSREVQNRRYYNEPPEKHTSFCRCGWTGEETNTKTSAARQYKLHKRYPELSKKSMALAAEDLLKTFVMAHQMEMNINIPEWRATLSVFAESVQAEQKRKKNQKYHVTYRTRGRGDLPYSVSISFTGYDSGRLGTYEFNSWVNRNKGREHSMTTNFTFSKLNWARNLAKATSFLLHAEEKATNLKHDYAKWAGWAVEWREELLADAKIRAKKALKASKKRTTWEYLKEKYPTRESVEEVLAEKTFSKSYTALLNRLVKYHAKREE